MGNFMHYVFLAGIGNSEPEHWQSIWYRSVGPNGHWVEHVDWDNPVADDWVCDLERCLRSLSGPKVLIAHSLGCLLVAEWAKRHRDQQVVAALLVSLPNAAGPAFPRAASGFAAAVDSRLPFAALMIASSNDPYSSIAYAQRVADQWAIPLIDVGAKGHLNLASNLGEWPEGRTLLEGLISTSAQRMAHVQRRND
jgi:predicted alpha/beta hydrolase family esterase